MIVLASQSDIVRVVTGSAVTTDVVVNYEDTNQGAAQFGSTRSAITTAATTTVLASPAASSQRKVLSLVVRNTHATSTQTAQVSVYDGSTAYKITPNVLLYAGESLVISPTDVFMLDANGQKKIENNSLAMTVAEHVHYEAPIAAELVTIKAAADVANGAVTIAAQPDFPRKLQVRIVDGDSSITAGTLTLVGVGASGQAVTQTIALTGGTQTVITTDAYATLTSGTVANLAGAAAGDTLGIGVGAALALPATYSPTPGSFSVFKSDVNNANEAVGTVDEVAGTISPTSAANASRTFDFWYTYKITSQPTITMAAHVHYEAPITADLTTIVAALDPIANANLTIAAQPDFPRKLQIRVVDANSSTTAGTLTITGKNQHGLVVSESFSLSGGTATKTSVNAYATLTSAVVSGVVGAAAGDTIGIGPATALALPAALSPVPGSFSVFKSCVANANEAVGTVDSTAGTIVPTSVPNGTRVYDFFYTFQVRVA